jgi:hypothetical protein
MPTLGNPDGVAQLRQRWWVLAGVLELRGPRPCAAVREAIATVRAPLAPRLECEPWVSNSGQPQPPVPTDWVRLAHLPPLVAVLLELSNG